MSQQIINIPINWDDEVFERVIEKGVIEEVKNKVTKETMKRCGLERGYGYNHLFEDMLRDCMRELVDANKDKIIDEIISRGHKSLINSKVFKEARKDMEAWMNE